MKELPQSPHISQSTWKSHLEHVQEWNASLLADKILDIGCGTGKFLIEVAKAGGDAVGIELSDGRIADAHERAKNAGVPIEVVKGFGESLPFPAELFGFVNMSELIEHVQDPHRVLSEVYRVLKTGGMAYMSVPNRFGIWDPHAHVYFVNWLPRAYANTYLKLFNKQKDDSRVDEVGMQRLETMHYYTLSAITRLCNSLGFDVIDIREQKIKKMRISKIHKAAFLIAYKIVRLIHPDTFHLELIKIARSK